MGHRHSLQRGGRLEAWNNGRNGAGRGRCGITVVAVVRLGQLEGGSHKHLVGRLGPDGLLYHPDPEEACGQGVSAFLKHAPEDEGGGRWGRHLTLRTRSVRWYEAWRVAQRGRGSGGEVTIG